MLVDAVRLLLFPAAMAFAASTDLFTMTISNRVSLVLAAGFLGLAALDAMPAVEIGSHLAAGFCRACGLLRVFLPRLDRRR